MHTRKIGERTGQLLIRGEPIPEGLYHIVVEVLAVHQDGSVLLTRRDYNKGGYPGPWESSAGGSVQRGEDPETAARRELHEETGLAADVLQPIFTDLSQDSIYMGYSCFISAKKDSVVLQPGETVEYLWADKEEFIKIYNSKEYVPPLRKRLRETVGRLFGENAAE